ncbi:peptidase domain-containing ABC transporter [Olivibacter jilunii]|uniref:peptidase domain-containing ABC transporter n=1 Tax=Olivibacter jilunii TaxID=985016 RepID=UPI003F15B1AF
MRFFSVKRFPFYRQFDSMDCGPTCLKMIAKYYGQDFKLDTLRSKAQIEREGVSILGLSEAAESIGYRTIAAYVTWEQLSQKILFPCIAHWNNNHFIVVYKTKRDKVYVADPSKGLLTYTKEQFISHWIDSSDMDAEYRDNGAILLLYPTPKIYELSENQKEDVSLSYIFKYLTVYRKLIFQLILGFLIASIIQIMLPFMTQSLVDVGINDNDVGFIKTLLLAQFFLLGGQVSIDIIRSWVVLHISTRVNVSILSDFFMKLMNLPIKYFETRKTGDILQRINDHKRIEDFLTGQTLSTLFSSFNIVIFSVVLAYYNLLIFSIFFIASVLYIFWVFLFLKFRRKIDFQRFEILSRNQGSMIQLIQGIQEIKLTNSEKQKRWSWENIQAESFFVQIKSLNLTQYQEIGAFFINQGKNIVITFLSALAVLKGTLSLGEMLAIQFIIGQLNSPLQQLITFMQSVQDAKISLERLNEIQKEENEEIPSKDYIKLLPAHRTIEFRNVSFTYPGAGNEPVLRNLNLIIPEGQTTAIVGTSGSGKTSICKLLLKFYSPTEGKILVGGIDFEEISHKVWRENCSSVLQDSFIFSETIKDNISVGQEYPDFKNIRNAAKIANIEEFIDSLPLKYDTLIGSEGNGISQGQRQRILIARAVFRNPTFIFLDEATNALDANNESSIMENLGEFLHGRTAIIVAHRLSTVKNADNIVVLKNGEVVEQGKHDELLRLGGAYYELVTNQLAMSYGKGF